jgi:hypothetical protein
LGRTSFCCLVVCLSALALTVEPAAARSHFRPRIGHAWGIVPPANKRDVASGTSIPVVYHGGSVMHGVTVHTVFWAPRGFRFNGPATPGTLGYVPLLQQYLSDAAHDSGGASNVFSVLPEYPDRGRPGRYAISYSAPSDSLDDTDPYPRGHQCPSPAGIPTCLTDLQIQHELDKVIQAHEPNGRGLHDLWFVFLPPNVDTCVGLGECGTTVFAGYHSLSNVGHGPTVYAVVPDPLIEFVPPPGSDPQGNPDAETSVDTVAHETVEAITDPEGTGWMDPNGFEVGDKCEFEYGTPLGFVSNGSPYNQVINGRRYLTQEMWSNARQGCKQRSTSTTSALPLARVTLRQFSPVVSGNIGVHRRGVGVEVALARANFSIVADTVTQTRADGSWSARPVDASGAPHAPGDDREILLVQYGPNGPRPDVIATGAGGNPFTESGWTGWYDLDSGYQIARRSVAVSPCGQTGVLSINAGATTTAPPIELCNGETDIARVATPQLTPRTAITIGSQDNRAVTLDNPPGALNKLIIRAGEPGAVGNLPNNRILLSQSGFPRCTADLEAQAVRCVGLRSHARYGMANHTARADSRGAVRFSLPIHGGATLSLRNVAGRVVAGLHVAHLRVDIQGHRTVLAGGHCQPGDYYGSPLSRPPVSQGIGAGVDAQGRICPGSGNPAGLSAGLIEQIDDLSGGLTRTEVPDLEHATPADGDTVYGPFIAFARSGVPGPNGSIIATRGRISLTILRGGSHRVAFRARNVEKSNGVSVRSLPRGAYVAKWVVRDANGDTRTVQTQFAEER